MPISTGGKFYREVHLLEEYDLYAARGYQLQFDCNDVPHSDDNGGWIRISRENFLSTKEGVTRDKTDGHNYKWRAVWTGNIEDMP